MEESSLDQVMVLDDKELEATMDQVDKAIDGAMQAGPDVAIGYGRRLRSSGQTCAIALSRLLYLLKERWESFPTDDTFEDAVLKGMGLSQQTVDKYIRVWQRVFENETIGINDKIRLMGKPMNSLLAISAAAGEGQLDEDTVEEIINAHDTAAVKEIVRRVRGIKTSATNSLTILLERDGRLRAKRGDGRYHEFGSLIDSGDQVVRDAIERIVRTAGIQRR